MNKVTDFVRRTGSSGAL